MGLPCRILLAVSSFAQPFVLFKAIESVPVTDVSESQSRSLFFVTILVYGSISVCRSNLTRTLIINSRFTYYY